ncbi:ATP-binding protein (plasmid) [Nocardia sp. NBC_01377]|uniref:ATP-binding protein n=1 Tax=Nocardia sp. NBC_01377 TaxID=2903595 RepID=UPI002F9169C4
MTSRTRKPVRRRESAYTPASSAKTITAIPPDSPLTTKEGWGRFVGHTPAPPPLLTAAQLLGMTPQDRAAHEDRLLDYHADLPLVNTPTIQEVISAGRLLVQLNRRQISARRGMVISGMSGTGKTTALTQLGRAHEIAVRRRYPGQGERLPIIYVTVPPAATPRMLAVEFARFLGLDFPTRANVTDITDAVCSVAAHTHVDLVLVDEIHNISLTSRSGAEASDQLKYFAERLPATFIYAGVEVEAQGLFAGPRGRQIAGRFTVVPATSFAYGTAEQRTQWQALVAAVESTLRLRDHIPGTLASMAEQLYRRSGGMIGSLSQIIRGAAILAIEDGTEKITSNLLDLVPVDYAAQRSNLPIAASTSRTSAAAPR